jgi:hypothetical protein
MTKNGNSNCWCNCTAPFWGCSRGALDPKPKNLVATAPLSMNNITHVCQSNPKGAYIDINGTRPQFHQPSRHQYDDNNNDNGDDDKEFNESRTEIIQMTFQNQ